MQNPDRRDRDTNLCNTGNLRWAGSPPYLEEEILEKIRVGILTWREPYSCGTAVEFHHTSPTV
jgi:hypothetical protein